jgi:queuine tRNA-ribosyltransferase
VTAARFRFELLKACGQARRGRLATAHGTVETPAFVPVGTAATVKGLTPEAVAETGTEMVLANTYHLMLRPGAERIERLGGLHRFMNWSRPILTDSGGFQVMSLAKLREIDEAGVTFQSHIDGTRHHLSPERAVDIQRRLGADVSMAFDECTPFPSGEAEAAESMRLSMRWAERSREAFTAQPGCALFGINQGGVYPELRVESADRLKEIGFDGYAIGGLAVGEGQETTFRVLDATVPHFPEAAPRYLMGAGRPDDIIGAVERGIDLFDCVLPTRSGRTGHAFTRRGVVNIRNARHADDPRPLDESCACPTCTGYSRAYLRHLAQADEILGAVLLTWHNLTFYQDLMRGLRDAIEKDGLESFAAAFLAELARGDIEPS